VRSPARRPLVPILLLFCGTAPAALGDEALDREAIAAAAEAWIAAYDARDVEAMAALTAENVVLLDPVASPIVGREKAVAAWRDSAPSTRAGLAIDDKEISVAGDFAWRLGAVMLQGQDGRRALRGYVLEIWKHVDGRWKLYRQMPSDLSGSPRRLPAPLPSEPVFDEPPG
jgi:ketosteroid isomerase-like protein